nr:uncharacterized protein LOC117987244 [Maniola hyperantus]
MEARRKLHLATLLFGVLKHGIPEYLRKKLMWFGDKEKVKKYLVLFLETSSIHGLNHLVAVGRRPCEIFLWFTMVVLSVFGTVYLSWSTWARYQSSPTVVSMERDMYSWNTTFPCVTLCPEEKIDPTKLDTYLESINEDDKENFKKFVKALSNTTFENFNLIPEYEGIDPDDYLELLLNLSSLFKPTLAYIHGPFDAPDVTAQHYHSPEFLYMTLYVHTIAVYTSPEAARLSLAQRGCRLYYENNLKHNPVYSYNFCRTECRIQLSLKYCQCIPYFYRKIACTVPCLAKGLSSIPPPFPIPCHSSSGHSLQEWPIGTTTLQWGMVTYPRMRLKRDVIFGFTDVLVAVGGMAGLFLGCSVLSFAEIIYFLTLRLICYTKTNIKK